MKILIEEKKTREIEIEAPSFFRISDFERAAILDDNNVITVFDSGDYKAIINKPKRFSESEIKKMIDENIITEAEFFEHYNSVHESLNLMPVLK